MIDLDSLLEASKKAKEKAALEIPVVKVVSSGYAEKPVAVASQEIVAEKPTDSSKQAILKDLWAKDRELRNARAKLSSQLARMIDNQASQEEFKAMYVKIESFRPDMQRNYELIQYVEKWGRLPIQEPPKVVQHTEDINALKVLKKSLSEERSKAKKNLQKRANAPEYSDWIIHWQDKLAIADARYQEVCEKIKRLNGLEA